MHSKLHPLKKIVPDPLLPFKQSSSPKCGNALATEQYIPVLHLPQDFGVEAVRSLEQDRPQLLQLL